ncbi:hypothetical protein DBR06_SOUSAS40310002, partial [Sousa chinensis]
LTAVHLLVLHETGSNNPTGISSNMGKITFHPYCKIKDILGALFLFLILLILVVFSPELLADPDNYTPANPSNTPHTSKQSNISYLHTQFYDPFTKNRCTSLNLLDPNFSNCPNISYIKTTEYNILTS